MDWFYSSLFFFNSLILKQKESEAAKEMQEDYERAKMLEQIKEHERWEKNVQYQEHLDKQLLEQEQIKHQQYEEFLREKHMIDEIVRKIYEEDQRYLVKLGKLFYKYKDFTKSLFITCNKILTFHQLGLKSYNECYIKLSNSS